METLNRDTIEWIITSYTRAVKEKSFWEVAMLKPEWHTTGILVRADEPYCYKYIIDGITWIGIKHPSEIYIAFYPTEWGELFPDGPNDEIPAFWKIDDPTFLLFEEILLEHLEA